VTSTYLESAAVSTDLQGAVLAEVEPLDDDGRPVTLGPYLLEVLLSDISERQRVPIVRAVVARDNARSLRLCARASVSSRSATTRTSGSCSESDASRRNDTFNRALHDPPRRTRRSGRGQLHRAAALRGARDWRPRANSWSGNGKEP
jgi:hypothetical protein